VGEVNSKALDFCKKINAVDILNRLLICIKNKFDEARKVVLNVEKDPEIEDTWLGVNIITGGDPEKVLSQYNEYLQEYLSLVPTDKQVNIRTSLSLI
jgi:hypothetical protein